MKKIILSLIALGFASASSLNAEAFFVPARTTVTGETVTAEVYNPYPQMIRCRVQVIGVRNDRFYQNAWADLILGAGGYEYAYVYTTYPFFFVSGRATAQCQNY